MAESRPSALVTGCSTGGIGNSLARELNSRGVRVFATVRNPTSVPDLVELGIEPLSLVVDDPDSVKECFEEVQRRTDGRGLNYLINNAGRNYCMPALDVDFAEVRAMFDVNVFGVMRMCQTFAPLLIQAKGTIVQIGSLAGVMPYVFGSTYNASKAALHAYSNTLRVELAPFDVKVVTVITGGVQSRISRITRSLPEGSLYVPISEEYIRRQTYSQEGAMPHEAYAKSVVGQIVHKHPSKWIWEGNKSWVMWFVTGFLPLGLMDVIFTKMFNLWKLNTPTRRDKSD